MPATQKDSAQQQASVGIPGQVRAALKETLRQSEKSADQVAQGLSARVGARITETMLRDFVAESHPHRFPAEWVAAWTAETEDWSLLYVVTDALGLPRPTQQDADLLAYGKLSLNEDLNTDEKAVLKARILSSSAGSAKGAARG